MEKPLPPHLFALRKSEQRVVLLILLALLFWQGARFFFRPKIQPLRGPRVPAVNNALPLDEKTPVADSP